MLRIGLRSKLRRLGLYPQIPDQKGLVAQLSRLSWAAWSRHCDSGPISKTGVATNALSPAWAARFQSEIDVAPADTIKAQDRSFGYFHEPRSSEMVHLNRVNEYRAVTPSLLQALHEFLSENRGTIEESVGHRWRVSSVRPFYLRPFGQQGGKHFDGWPPAIRKIFILPRGATPETGTTWFKLRDGRELLLDEPRPLWTIFENSRVQHALTPGQIARPTIELNIVPARRTSTKPRYAGLNGWYPLFPWN